MFVICTYSWSNYFMTFMYVYVNDVGDTLLKYSFSYFLLLFDRMNSAQKEGSLRKAAAEGNIAIAKNLLAEGVDINAASNDIYGLNPLQEASKRGLSKTVEFLLAEGANVDVTDKLNRTPLHRSAEEGHTETVRVLLAGGANIHATNQAGKTPLVVAQARHHNDVVALLERAHQAALAAPSLAATPPTSPPPAAPVPAVMASPIPAAASSASLEKNASLPAKTNLPPPPTRESPLVHQKAPVLPPQQKTEIIPPNSPANNTGSPLIISTLAASSSSIEKNITIPSPTRADQKDPVLPPQKITKNIPPYSLANNPIASPSQKTPPTSPAPLAEETPLHLAAKGGYLELLDRGADINAVSKVKGRCT